MPLQNFVASGLPTIKSAWLNAQDIFVNTLFGGATTAAQARTAITAAASGANTDITSLAAPALGAATATTQAASDSSTKVATTAFAIPRGLVTSTGDIIYATANATPARLAIGSTGQVLRANSSAAPYWSSGAATIFTSVTTTSGTSNGSTGLPSTISRIYFDFLAVSTNGTSNLLLQIGPLAGLQTSSYASGATNDAGTRATSTAGFLVFSGVAAGNSACGTVSLALADVPTNTWVCSFVITDAASGETSIGGGKVALSGALYQFTLKAANGTDAFDAGSYAVYY